MAEEDQAAAELDRAVKRVKRLPRPTIKRKILENLFIDLANELNVELTWENNDR